MHQIFPQSFSRFLSVSASPRFNNPQHPGIRRQSAIARTDLAHCSSRHVGISTTVAVSARNCPRLRQQRAGDPAGCQRRCSGHPEPPSSTKCRRRGCCPVPCRRGAHCPGARAADALAPAPAAASRCWARGRHERSHHQPQAHATPTRL